MQLGTSKLKINFEFENLADGALQAGRRHLRRRFGLPRVGMPPKSKQQEAREYASKHARDEAAAKRAREGPKTKHSKQAQQAEAKAKRSREQAAALALVAEERGDALRKAAADGDVDALVAMLEKTGMEQFPIDNSNDDGLTALMKASMYGHSKAVKSLLDHDADVEMHDQRGRTALMLASLNGEVSVIRELLAYGARPAGAGELANRTGASDDGRTALMLAAASGHAEAVSLLLEADAPFRDVDTSGMSALDLAKSNSHDKCAAILEGHAAANASSAYKAPTAWGKVRKLKAAAHASEAFSPEEERQGVGLFASLLNGESSIGASALSWLNALVKSSEDVSQRLSRSLTRSFHGASKSFTDSFSRRGDEGEGGADSSKSAAGATATVLDTAAARDGNSLEC